jgi:hypothetical protein
LIAAVSPIAVAFLPACSRDAPLSCLFNAGDRADPASFLAFVQTYARDKSTAYVDGRTLPGADPSTFPPDQSVTRCDETSMSFAESP